MLLSGSSGTPIPIGMSDTTALLEAALALPEFLDVRVRDLVACGATVLVPAHSTDAETGCLTVPPVVGVRAGTRFIRESGSAA